MIVNLVSFLVITLGLITYGVVDLLGNPFQQQTVVSATFPDAAGVEPNFGVVLQGVVVGSVNTVRLTREGAQVQIALRPGANVPSNVVASIGLANDLGEQQIQLTPKGGASSLDLRNGQHIPVEKGGIPVQVGKVIGTASKLLRSIGAKQLDTVLATLGQGLAGQATNLQSMLVSQQQFSQEFLAYQQQFKALLANSAPVLNGLANDGAQLRQDLAATEVLANVLDRHRWNLVHMLANGAAASAVATRLLDATRPNLACILHDFANIAANNAEPQNLSNLSVGLATNEWFFGAVNGISPTGPAKSLFPGDPYNPTQVWLRTRLFIPPGSPPANQYATPTKLNPVMPGAGCSTEFGPGVGPASQSSPQFPVTGTRYIPPSASQSQVRGGGDPPGSSASTSAYRRPSGSSRSPSDLILTAATVPSSRPNGWLDWLVLLLAVPLALALLIPRRRRHARVPVSPGRKER